VAIHAAAMYGNFGNLLARGCDMYLSRGSKPGVCRIRVPYFRPETLSPGTLLLSGDETVRFTGCVPDVHTVRPYLNADHEVDWEFLVYDRRKAWEGKTINGEYNVRYRTGRSRPAPRNASTNWPTCC